MKYRILLIGRNKILMEDFFQHIENFELQSASMRAKDIESHITYFKPDAILFCMNKEEETRTDTVISLKEELERNRVILILTGDLEECSAFQKSSGNMGNLILKKPITVRSIQDKVIQFLDELKEEEETRQIELAKEAEQAKQVKQAEKQREAGVSEKEKETTSEKKHILVVDDDPMMLKVIKEVLKDTYSVATAINGAIALKFLENKKADLIILDYEMPKENGAQVLEKIRNNPALTDLPVVFATGVKDREKIKKLVDLKPQGYLLKPIENHKLIRCIKKLIG